MMEERFAWVRCENICKTKENGGLGVNDLRCFNITLSK